jgi:kelch-like protein 8
MRSALVASSHVDSTLRLASATVGILSTDSQAIRDTFQPLYPVAMSSSASHSLVPLNLLADQEMAVNVDTVPMTLMSGALTFEDKSLWRNSFGVLHDFFNSRTFCDVDICIGSQQISCHRLVLACFSQYFRSMFTSDMSECRNKTITIHDIDETAMMSLIEFAYTAKITLTTDNVQLLLYACSILQVESVARACCEFMAAHLHVSNCIGVRNFAEQHGHRDLVMRADQFILDNFIAVTMGDEFRDMSHKNLETIVSSSYVNVHSEIEIYEAVMRWIKFNVTDNYPQLPKLLSRLRLSQLPPSYLIDVVCTEELIRSDTVCRDYLDEAKHYQMSLAQLVPSIPLTERMLPRKSYAGVLFCVGGRGTSGTPFKTIECYDPRKNLWIQVVEMSTRRRHVGVVAVGNKLYAVGGHDGTEHLKSGEVFDPVTNKWQSIAPMSKLRRGIALAHLNGPIYAVGGLDDMACFSTVERYDPESDTWSQVQNMNYARGGVAVASFRNYLYAIGGNNGTASLDTCERYDPYLNKWTAIEPMKKRRAGAGVAELHGSLYVVGGFDDNAPLDCVEKYDPITNSWSTVVSMSCPRGGVGVAAMGGKLYAVGGHDGTNYLSSVEEYDPCTDRWTQVANIGTCRAGAGVAVVTCHAEDLKDITNITPTAGICL